MYGLKRDWILKGPTRVFVLEDYLGAEPRWCPGCGDHAILTALKRVAPDLQLAPEQTVVISGIGGSSRLPHYLNTYGFHGLHGRALPVACGIRSRRPDLHIFVITGDGDCCAIGTSHWIHALRYNTHPQGSPFVPINPMSIALGIPNVSFLAQTIDWNPPHLYQTLRAAHDHQGASSVRIFQRCPHYTANTYERVRSDPNRALLLRHADGVSVNADVTGIFGNQMQHDPANLEEARGLADVEDLLVIGLFYRNRAAQQYDATTAKGLGMPPEKKLKVVGRELDRFSI